MSNGLDEVLEIIEQCDMKHDMWHRYLIRRLLKRIDDQEIIAQIGMAELPQIIDLLFYKYGGRYQLIDIGGDCMFRFGKNNVANTSYLPTFIHFISIENDVLKMEGNTSWPTVLDRYFKFNVLVNGLKYNCEMYDANLDLYHGKNGYETRKAFVCEIKLYKTRQYKLQFNYECNGIDSVSGKINSLRFSPVADCICGQYCILENWMIYIQNNAIVLEQVGNEEEKIDKENAFQREILRHDSKNGEWAVKLRKRYFATALEKKRQIWLFMDRTDRADDNAEVFFKYMQQHSEIDSYFIIDKKSKDYMRLFEIGNVVELYSEEHYLLALLADYVISSQCNGVVENPFWDKAEYFRDLYHKPKIIFLQHGVIKDDMSFTLNRFNTNFTGFITSTSDEYNSILDYPYFYSKKEVWCTGLPIFDELENRPQKIILVMPTWRQGLMRQVWNEEKETMEWVPIRDIKESGYYKAFYSLLHNKKLVKVCEAYGYKIAFKPHPLLEPFVMDIADEKNLVLWDRKKSYKDAFAEGGVLITDYSSVAFEFAYLRKPILYYQFDEKDFFESHTYCKGYFNYVENGFGEVECQEDSMVDKICSYIKTDCKLSEKYKERIDYAFSITEKKVCEQIYKRMYTGGETS